MDHLPSEELLESVHAFPGVYQIRVIGLAADQFEARVIEAVIAELSTPSEVDYVSRTTPGGRHISLTLDLTVQNPGQVRKIYERILDIEGVTLVL
ncbi:MAG: DUF493 domain-containing protein [Planctomycetota bacterium]|nr:DUF493 domain-containing protein [Planctomycetota bacterium]